MFCAILILAILDVRAFIIFIGDFQIHANYCNDNAGEGNGDNETDGNGGNICWLEGRSRGEPKVGQSGIRVFTYRLTFENEVRKNSIFYSDYEDVPELTTIDQPEAPARRGRPPTVPMQSRGRTRWRWQL